ncbi:hypothetical protein [Aliiruegeria sabulilitoris]|uniref:hypothetical protein n=1 Tax=Aliiruegeria sabulilitoris TaxID=1510458 RepID=UPI00082C3210|nr:hypothetical protein [Aliiruegeria sabulilitoris]NDR57177.1 hypothetical protein [Pseudoruegeria sp. M32A2M]
MENSCTNSVAWMTQWKDFEYEVEDTSDIASMRDRLFDAGAYVLSETVCATQVQLLAAGWELDRVKMVGKCEHFARKQILYRADPSLAFFAHVDYDRLAEDILSLVAPPPLKPRIVFSAPLSDINELADDFWDWS